MFVSDEANSKHPLCFTPPLSELLILLSSQPRAVMYSGP